LIERRPNHGYPPNEGGAGLAGVFRLGLAHYIHQLANAGGGAVLGFSVI